MPTTYVKAHMRTKNENTPSLKRDSILIYNAKKNAKVWQTPSRGWVKSKIEDKQRKAKKPGRRTSKSGTTYYEHRANRSDKNPKVRL